MGFGAIFDDGLEIDVTAVLAGAAGFTVVVVTGATVVGVVGVVVALVVESLDVGDEWGAVVAVGGWVRATTCAAT